MDIRTTCKECIFATKQGYCSNQNNINKKIAPWHTCQYAIEERRSMIRLPKAV